MDLIICFFWDDDNMVKVNNLGHIFLVTQPQKA